MNTITPEIEKLYPYSVQIELVEGCNYRCWFCGLLSMTPENQAGTNFMSLPGLRKVFRDLNDWLPKIRVEINNHGEPTLHPQFFESVAIMREEFPKSSINLQTNNEKVVDKDKPKNTKKWIKEYWKAGGTLLILNAYKPGRYEWWLEFFKEYDIEFVDVYYNNPQRLSPYRYYPPNKRHIFLWHDLSTVNIDGTAKKIHQSDKYLNNQGGNAIEKTMVAKTGKPIRPLPMKSKCSKVFRELILNWDGGVPVCCLDWLDLHIMGNAFKTNIKDIWFNDRFNATRQLLFNRRRDLLKPCNRCNEPTTRVGFLKDPAIPLTDLELLRVVDKTGPTEGRGVESPTIWPAK